MKKCLNSFKASIKTMGEYSCEGVNKLGSVKTTANVSVFGKFYIYNYIQLIKFSVCMYIERKFRISGRLCTFFYII